MMDKKQESAINALKRAALLARKAKLTESEIIEAIKARIDPTIRGGMSEFEGGRLLPSDYNPLSGGFKPKE
jgi:hypothetical protein